MPRERHTSQATCSVRLWSLLESYVWHVWTIFLITKQKHRTNGEREKKIHGITYAHLVQLYLLVTHISNVTSTHAYANAYTLERKRNIDMCWYGWWAPYTHVWFHHTSQCWIGGLDVWWLLTKIEFGHELWTFTVWNFVLFCFNTIVPTLDCLLWTENISRRSCVPPI